MQVLILIDEDTLDQFTNGSSPNTPYSHDKNLLQFAHESLRCGFKVFFAAAQLEAFARPYFAVEQIYPLWTAQMSPFRYNECQPDIVVSVYPEALNVRSYFPSAKIVAIHAAIQWLEVPERFSSQYLYDLITAIRFNIDYMITQNARMKEILQSMYMFLAKWPFDDRILVAPLGIVEEERRSLPDRESIRAEMGLKRDDIAIINSGGIWRWTDFNTFFRAFCEYSNSKKNKLKLFIMGIKQHENFDHDSYIDEFEDILFANRNLLGENIFIINDWDRASSLVKKYTYGSDIGLNVNKSSLENWQSYRLRFLDYMHFGMPVINTLGDTVSDQFSDAVYACRSGEISDYFRILKDINGRPGLINQRGTNMKRHAQAYDSKNTYGKAVQVIASGTQRNPSDTVEWKDSVIDYTVSMVKMDVRRQLREKILGEIY